MERRIFGRQAEKTREYVSLPNLAPDGSGHAGWGTRLQVLCVTPFASLPALPPSMEPRGLETPRQVLCVTPFALLPALPPSMEPRGLEDVFLPNRTLPRRGDIFLAVVQPTEPFTAERPRRRFSIPRCMGGGNAMKSI